MKHIRIRTPHEQDLETLFELRKALLKPVGLLTSPSKNGKFTTKTKKTPGKPVF